jgi:putative transposase
MRCARARPGLASLGPPPTARARHTRRFLDGHPEIQTVFLPPDAPELNPVEGLWSYLKINPLANAEIFDLDGLAFTARRHTRALQRNERLLRSFIAHCGLSLRLR